jgi:beta-glucanase (GH16 family)
MWPASGEIDIMESRGNDNYPHSAEGGCDSYGSTLHWGVDWTQNRYDKTHGVYHHPNGRLSDEFHTYGLYWSEDRLYTYIDSPDNIVMDVDLDELFYEKGEFSDNFQNPWRGEQERGAPFNQEFHIIINLAVGGTVGFFPEGVGNKPWSNSDSNAVNKFYDAKNQWYETWKNPDVDLEIDSVKVWSFE